MKSQQRKGERKRVLGPENRKSFSVAVEGPEPMAWGRGARGAGGGGGNEKPDGDSPNCCVMFAGRKKHLFGYNFFQVFLVYYKKVLRQLFLA